MAEKLLIIGGSGYLGSVLTDYLLRNSNMKIDVVDNLFYKQNSLASNCRFKKFKFEFFDVFGKCPKTSSPDTQIKKFRFELF